ncbi:energy-coupling factor transporter transmembrane component T family protein [Natrarchaeobius oligotrophus]|uniref:Energy-coupling factor transporter transmembrane protein EcfT n=1 Tax=Natrarchaeobius chitinivorans TaxID=1679083 RepID=A0A3N6MBX1_NATCH|nr:energy-coupling factor transporter transmembrane component T [Natrarchaeobius chitinivorans]RQH01354.1 energy-coupling factor transporter transmembrane protein EcfT [Natrarchaeobius chitinivorans]
MLSYEPDDTVVHRLDPRSKLAFQIGFAAAALAHATPRALIALTGLCAVVLAAARVPIRETLYAYRLAVAVLAFVPLVAAVTFGPPWIDVDDGIVSARASYRVFLILLVSAAYVRSTPVRHSRAAIQRTVPGKPGQILGVGVALVFRFFPVLQADLRTIREAMAARLGDERGPVERASTIAILGLTRTFERADRLALALQARCFAWNPTMPPLTFSRSDVPVLGLSGALVLAAFL